ncbi:MAG: phosphatidate cytidylyltransferase [Planctomycetes bacterium]|nr:phosphatidate cytidylyltransferase [Planctomycetota bacterium]
MLFQRILAATFMIGLLTAAMCADYYYFENSFLLHAFCLIGTFFCLREFWVLCRARGMQTFSTWGTLSGLALVAAHFWALQIWSSTGENLHDRVAYLNRADKVITGAMAVAVMGVFFLTARRHQYEASLGGLGITCLGLIYLWFLPSFLLKLRHLGDDGMLGGTNWNTFGSKMVVATIVISKGCDVFAYLIGRKLGKHKAFPDLSPGKTKEGVAAGLIGSVLLALLLRAPFLNVLPEVQFGLIKAIIFGFCIGISGIMGDLSESLLKRSAGVKDASHVVPGYGGVLDVIDSLVIAGPVAYFLVPLMI